MRSALVNYELKNVLRYILPYVFMALGLAIAKGEIMENLRALAWNIRHLGGTLDRRRDVQSNRRLRDRDLKAYFETSIRGPGR